MCFLGRDGFSRAIQPCGKVCSIETVAGARRVNRFLSQRSSNCLALASGPDHGFEVRHALNHFNASRRPRFRKSRMLAPKIANILGTEREVSAQGQETLERSTRLSGTVPEPDAKICVERDRHSEGASFTQPLKQA